MRVQGKAIGAGDVLVTPTQATFKVDNFSPAMGRVYGHAMRKDGTWSPDLEGWYGRELRRPAPVRIDANGRPWRAGR